jgi:Protein of unknown function (DUF2795)
MEACPTAWAGCFAGKETRVGQRKSTKHGPRLDEELARESEAIVEGAGHASHVEEFRETEESTVDERGLPSDPLLARREISRHLDTRVFPAGRDELLANAREHQAPEAVIELLERLPADADFRTLHELWRWLGTLPETTLLGVDPRSDEIGFETRAEGRRAPADSTTD